MFFIRLVSLLNTWVPASIRACGSGPSLPRPISRAGARTCWARSRSFGCRWCDGRGGFADEYHWRDGVGPRGRRPVKINTNWGGVAENNAVGTHEFFDLVELLGAQAYVNGNLGSGTVAEMADWIEYMTADGESTLAKQRRKNGRDKPFKVDYFAIGNEACGCGGNMTPEYYANLYKQYYTFLKAPEQHRPKMIASGGNDYDTSWTDVLNSRLKGQTQGISFHYYTIPTGKWDVKGGATGFDEAQWMSTLANTLKLDALIKNNVAVLDKTTRTRRLACSSTNGAPGTTWRRGPTQGFYINRTACAMRWWPRSISTCSTRTPNGCT